MASTSVCFGSEEPTAFLRVMPAHGDAAPTLQRSIGMLCRHGGGVLELGPGTFHVASPLEIPCALRVEGSGWSEAASNPHSAGTTISIEQGRAPALTLARGSRGATVRDLAFVEPVQRQTLSVGKSWHPVAMPPVIAIRDVNGVSTLDNIFVEEADRGIASAGGGRTVIDGLWGQFFDSAISLDNEQDISRINDVHSWPFFTTDPKVIAYQQDHLATISLGHVDGAFIDNVFAFAARSGIHFVQGEGGVATGIEVGKISCDSVDHCLEIDAQNVTLMIGEMRQFGQRGISSGEPLDGADAILINGQASVLAGEIEAGMIDRAFIDVTNRSACSNVRVSSVLADFSRSHASSYQLTNAPACGPNGEADEVLFGLRPAIVPPSRPVSDPSPVPTARR